ncbi:NADH dehydrogenase [ubiquinone] 1 alpha subcomplex subunit 4 [Stylophora pistillata]|uniref:NADH dehydrogenase [ubiquinone] 1 alpha subcomplex subunit 4 n=1 Tax=Stylophora pistillata TaxID=50429 RepID=A0A2B4RUU4_STYPI|nr:NADH dehydrogenase [ubiquinone] 1 alpha subcomplex subunit 4 [Stylophora pistillata]
MVLALLRKSPELTPLFLIIGTGCAGAVAFTIRQATKNPEASWDKKNNPHPWLNVKHDEQLKLIPLFAVVGAGCVGAGYYLMRLATKNPDATYVYE